MLYGFREERFEEIPHSKGKSLKIFLDFQLENLFNNKNIVIKIVKK